MEGGAEAHTTTSIAVAGLSHFRNLSGWFSCSVNPGVVRLWVKHGGSLQREHNANYLFSDDSFTTDTMRLYDWKDDLVVFKSTSIHEVLCRGCKLEEVDLKCHILPLHCPCTVTKMRHNDVLAVPRSKINNPIKVEEKINLTHSAYNVAEGEGAAETGKTSSNEQTKEQKSTSGKRKRYSLDCNKMSQRGGTLVQTSNPLLSRVVLNNDAVPIEQATFFSNINRESLSSIATNILSHPSGVANWSLPIPMASRVLIATPSSLFIATPSSFSFSIPTTSSAPSAILSSVTPSNLSIAIPSSFPIITSSILPISTASFPITTPSGLPKATPLSRPISNNPVNLPRATSAIRPIAMSASLPVTTSSSFPSTASSVPSATPLTLPKATNFTQVCSIYYPASSSSSADSVGLGNLSSTAATPSEPICSHACDASLPLPSASSRQAQCDIMWDNLEKESLNTPIESVVHLAEISISSPHLPMFDFNLSEPEFKVYKIQSSGR